MANKRTKGDIVLDFRNKDFSTMTEKGLDNTSDQAHPLKLLELFGGIGAPRRALQNIGFNLKSIDYVEVLPYAVRAYNEMFDCGPDIQDIRIWNMSPDIVVHGSPCFVAGTMIKTTDGLKPIETLRPGMSVDINGNYCTIVNFFDNGDNDVYDLTFDDGYVVSCTPNHRFLVVNNEDYGQDMTWMTAIDLAINSTQICTDDKFTTRRLISRTNRRVAHVYDIEVENAHAFCLANGMIVHNCQDWSNEGKNNVNTGRSILFERVLQILDPNPIDGYPELSRRPKVVIWENVPRLSWVYKDVLDYYIDVMSEFGYMSYNQVLTASDFNIPQDRDRVFVVSIHESVAGFDKFKFPDKMKQTYTLRQFIDKTVDFDDPEVQLTATEASIIDRLPDGTLTVKEGTKKGYKEVKEWQIINLALPNSKTRRGRVGDNAKTITTGPRQAIFYNNKVRMLSAKEYLRLMGYKDVDYKKMVAAGITNKQICTLAGNSICVPVLEAIFRQLVDLGILVNPESTYAKKKKKN